MSIRKSVVCPTTPTAWNPRDRPVRNNGAVAIKMDGGLILPIHFYQKLESRIDIDLKNRCALRPFGAFQCVRVQLGSISVYNSGLLARRSSHLDGMATFLCQTMHRSYELILLAAMPKIWHLSRHWINGNGVAFRRKHRQWEYPVANWGLPLSIDQMLTNLVQSEMGTLLLLCCLVHRKWTSPQARIKNLGKCIGLSRFLFFRLSPNHNDLFGVWIQISPKQLVWCLCKN